MADQHHLIPAYIEGAATLGQQHRLEIQHPLTQCLCASQGLTTLQQGLHGGGVAAWMLHQHNRPTG